MKKVKIYFIFICLLFLYKNNYANISTHELTFDRLGLSEGLSQSTIFCMLQDSKGFMWFGTMDGLNRYDGHRIKIFRNTPFDSSSLSENFIHFLFEDRDKNLWIGTHNGGLNKFDPIRETFSVYNHEPNDIFSISSDIIYCIDQDQQGALWIGTQNGLNKFDIDSGKFRTYRFLPTDVSRNTYNEVLSICIDRKGNIWIGTNGSGIFVFDHLAEKFYRLDSKGINSKFFLSTVIQCIYEDQLGHIYVGSKTNGQIKITHYSLNKRHIYPIWEKLTLDSPKSLNLPPNNIRDIIEDRKDNLWFGTRNGLYKYARQNGSFQVFHKDDRQSHSISDNSITCLYEDRSGVFWIGTWAGGVNKLTDQNQVFKHYSNFSKFNSLIQSDIILSIFEDASGYLWIGTNQAGLLKFDPFLQKFTQYKHDPDDDFSLSHNIVQAILEDQSSTLWIGTWGGGLNRFDRRKSKFYRISHPGKDVNLRNNQIIHCLYEDDKGRIWIGTEGGLDLLNNDRTKILSFSQFFKQSTNFQKINIWTIYESKNGDIWIGTYGDGLFRFNELENSIQHYIHNPTDYNSLSNNTIWSIYETAQQELWIGTSAGLNKLDSNQTKFTHFFEKDGLPNECIYAILLDDLGYLWLSTNNGLSRFNPNKESGQKFNNYNIQDGLQSNEFNMGAYYKNQKGELFFGGINGFNKFKPSEIKINHVAPQVVLTDFKIFNKSIKYDSALYEKKRLSLSYKDKVISFQFASLDFSNPQKNLYAYKLEGFDSDWIYTNNVNHVTYTNLDPGFYVFKVKASNNDQIWNEEGTAIYININPPFWSTVWFRGIIFILFFIVLYTLHRYRITRILTMERIRTKIASDLHDEIGTNISKIGMYSEIIGDATRPEKIKESSRRIGEISREIVKTFGDVVWSIDARNDTIGDLIDKMQDSIHGLFSSRNIQVTLIHKQLNLQKKLPIEFKKDIYLIFKEAINNIFKHSNASKVEITLENKGHYFIMTIHDNGKNIESIERKSGQGLRNMAYRTKQIKGNLEISNKAGFKIILKIKAL